MKFWIGVACKEHVERGVALGICQFCHGKKAPANRPKKGDFVIYYSPKVDMDGPEICQQFTAIGRITDEAATQVDLGGFAPFRRAISYLKAQPIDIKPLVDKLDFIKNKRSWGYVFRFGFFEIDGASFDLIAGLMLGFNPLNPFPEH